MPNIINSIPNGRTKSYFAAAIYFLVYILFAYETYKDIKNNNYVTIIFVAITDLIIIATFSFVGYMYFQDYDTANIESMLRRYNITMSARLLGPGVMLLRGFLTSKRFKRKN